MEPVHVYLSQFMGMRHSTWQNSYSNQDECGFGTWDKNWVLFSHSPLLIPSCISTAFTNLWTSTSAQCSLIIFLLALSNSGQQFIALIFIKFIPLIASDLELPIFSVWEHSLTQHIRSQTSVPILFDSSELFNYKCLWNSLINCFLEYHSLSPRTLLINPFPAVDFISLLFPCSVTIG